MQMKSTQPTAIQPISGLQLPRFQGPGVKSIDPAQVDGDDVGDVEPDDRDRGHRQVGTGDDQRRRGQEIDSTTHSQIELVGVPVLGLTFPKRGAGQRTSRENAYVIRELAVTEAMPQRNWATQTMNSKNLATPGLPSESRKICAGGRPVSEAARVVSPSSTSGDRRGDRVEQDEAADQRDQHTHHDAAGRRDGGVLGLLGDVGRAS